MCYYEVLYVRKSFPKRGMRRTVKYKSRQIGENEDNSTSKIQNTKINFALDDQTQN